MQLDTQQQLLNQIQINQNAGNAQHLNEVVTELRRIVQSLITTQVVASIPPFKGNAKHFKRWIKNVERQVAAINGNDNAKLSAAIQTCSKRLWQIFYPDIQQTMMMRHGKK